MANPVRAACQEPEPTGTLSHGSPNADASLRPMGQPGEDIMSSDEPKPEAANDIQGFLARIQAGDEEAARDLLTRYEAEVRLVVRRQLPRLLRSRFDSLDFLQSVWGS